MDCVFNMCLIWETSVTLLTLCKGEQVKLSTLNWNTQPHPHSLSIHPVILDGGLLPGFTWKSFFKSYFYLQTSQCLVITRPHIGSRPFQPSQLHSHTSFCLPPLLWKPTPLRFYLNGASTRSRGFFVSSVPEHFFQLFSNWLRCSIVTTTLSSKHLAVLS